MGAPSEEENKWRSLEYRFFVDFAALPRTYHAGAKTGSGLDLGKQKKESGEALPLPSRFLVVVNGIKGTVLACWQWFSVLD